MFQWWDKRLLHSDFDTFDSVNAFDDVDNFDQIQNLSAAINTHQKTVWLICMPSLSLLYLQKW